MTDMKPSKGNDHPVTAVAVSRKLNKLLSFQLTAATD